MCSLCLYAVCLCVCELCNLLVCARVCICLYVCALVFFRFFFAKFCSSLLHFSFPLNFESVGRRKWVPYVQIAWWISHLQQQSKTKRRERKKAANAFRRTKSCTTKNKHEQEQHLATQIWQIRTDPTHCTVSQYAWIYRATCQTIKRIKKRTFTISDLLSSPVYH